MNFPKLLFPLLCNLLFPIFIFLNLSITAINADDGDPRGYNCNHSQNYTNNSTFSLNLIKALSTLQNTTAATGFSTVTISASSAANSSDPESVTAAALCRGSLTQTECQTCMDLAIPGTLKTCKNKIEAQIWFTYCTIRYSSKNFLNESNDSIGFMLYDTRDAPDSVDFDPTVNALLRNLSSAAKGAERRFAVGKMRLVEVKMWIYGYVDCTRDVGSESCGKCLVRAIDGIGLCCLGKWAGWVASPSCSIQFNMDPVHRDWMSALEVGAGGGSSTINNTSNEVPINRADSNGGDGGRRIAIGVSSAIVGAVILIFVAFLLIIKSGKKKKKKGVALTRRRSIEKNGDEEMTEIRDMEMSSLYSLDVLINATDNFSDRNFLGRGGFGPVYKGKIGSGEEIAVKKLGSYSMQGKEELLNEFRLLLKMQHRNLVRLLGCCIEDEEMMLVYEYMPNKSLDRFLFDKTKSAILDWEKRCNIISGVARGLLYLHQDSVLRIVHRDIKASNILLDEIMNPKIADFGMAKLFNDEQSHIRTRRIAGTYGYMAPEYAIRGLFSVKSDVFSFGILVLEIISGRKNFDLQFDVGQQELLKLSWKLEQEGKLMELVDVTMGEFPADMVLRWMRIGLLCTQEFIQDRPTMSSVMVMLSEDSVTIPPSGRPGYQGNTNTHIVESNTSTSSCNTISVSLHNGR